MVTSFMIQETPVHAQLARGSLVTKVKDQAGALWEAIRMPAIFWPAVFIFCWNGTPAPDGAMFFYQTNELNFSPDFLGKVGLVAAVCKLCGVAFFNAYLNNKP
eukprot:CAMPEP_0119144882 /NCGR_PEP_ID=MMETSP1310-20130426/36679_1 /TAXON_ID=464262 /ORGANISM="Genus nov. species nov., Strain RCC2339" /LENGTH=102 /DNA_ID=CAMNT_0007136663 /DNA_START=14 /DNA_END=319 /DNA_ORIENTATION=+